LAAQVFLFLLEWADVLILDGLGRYTAIDVTEAHAAGKPPEPFTTFHWWVPLATTLGGLISGFLVYAFAPEAEGHGTDAAVRAFHQTGGRIRARVPFIKTIASAVTIGSGGAAGREGPTAQIAAGIGSVVGTLLKLSDDDRRFLVLIGMAAGLSAIFKSPLGTAVFAVEILYSRVSFEGGALLYTLIGSAVAYAMAGYFSGFTPLFILPPSTEIGDLSDLGVYAVLGVIAGLLGAVLPGIFYGVRDGFLKLGVPNHVKPAIGGLLLGAIGIFVPQLLGGGYGYIQFALQGSVGMAVWFLLLLSVGKIVALSLTIGSGGSGGVFAPSLFVGALLGAAFATLLHDLGIEGINESALAVVGMAALFAGAARVPIASIVMVAEMTGGYGLFMPTMLAVAIAFLVQTALTRNARYPTLYEAQVPSPASSAVHHDEYYRFAAELLRNKEVKLDRDILHSELMTALDSGEGVPLSRRREHLYNLILKSGSPVAGQQVRSLGLDRLHVLIVGVIRGEHEFVPHGSNHLHVGDGLLVASMPDGFKAFRELVEPPKHSPEESLARPTTP
jgi:CIC family chloride channel protein